MAGVKGRSGGPRKNAGGARPGAGRPKKEKPPAPKTKRTDDPLKFLLEVMNDNKQDPALRVRAASEAVKYIHAKKGEGGKKEGKAKAAKEVGGRFSPPAAPRLVVNNK